MASTNAHQIKNNDQNSLCGLGDKIRRLTAGVCLFTQFFPRHGDGTKCGTR